MPLTVDTHSVPTAVAEVRYTDVDGDGTDEIVLLSHAKVTGQPDAASLTIVNPATRAVRTVALGNRPMFISPSPTGSAGLWALGTTAWERFATDHFEKTEPLASPLGQLGRATPTFAELTKAVLPGPPARVAWSGGKYTCTRAESPGGSCGSVPAPARGALQPTWQQGGQVLAATLTPPPLSITDADGDGLADLLMPDRTTMAVYYTGESGVGARAATWGLPIDLRPDDGPRQKGETRREVGDVWLDDLDGDHRVDLAAMRYVTNGSFFGATAELLFARGTGAGFAALQTVPFASAAFGAQLVDVDGDGDKDVITGLVDIGMRNLATALVSHVVRADLVLVRNNAGTLAAPTTLHGVSFPLDQPDAFHVDFQGDVDGDHRVDLVAAEDGRVNVYRGTASGMEAAPALSAELSVPQGDGTLRTHDLDHDGRAEIVCWGKDAGKIWILRG